MHYKTKAVLAGTVIGAAAATVAAICYIKKRVIITKVYLFDTSNQENKVKQIEEMLPTEQNTGDAAPHAKKRNKMNRGI